LFGVDVDEREDKEKERDVFAILEFDSLFILMTHFNFSTLWERGNMNE
jgi:hypothetical protein